MNFLVPLYLAGALAVAIPIYLHLRRRPPKDSVEFSSLMFLEPTKHQPIKRKSQLENIPLLLLRCLALLLLAAMFSKPFLPGGEADTRKGKLRTVVLLDTSASMQREGLWEEATERVEEVLEEIQADGSFALLTVDRAPRLVTAFEDWDGAVVNQRGEIARSALEEIEPGWQGSDLGTGLIAAAELLADAGTNDEAPRPARIVVVSDLQSGAALEAVAEASWPPNLEVELKSIETDFGSNVTIVAAPTTNPNQPAIRVRNDPTSEGSRFTLKAGDQTIAAVVPPGESRVFHLEKPVPEATVTGDDFSFDNRLFLAPREPAPVKLLFLGDHKANDSNGPEYYFRRAFGVSQVLIPTFVKTLADEPALLGIARNLKDDEIRDVRKFLESGRDAVLILASIEMRKTLAALTDTPEATLSEYDRRYSLLEQIDFEHPSLRAFRDPRWRDFTDINFWRYRKFTSPLPESAKVIARFDSGSPAWIEYPTAGGSLLVMTSSWHPKDSQLSLSTKFLPLLFSIFAEHGPQVTKPKQFFVGSPLPLEESETTITLPDGDTEERTAEQSFRPVAPGLYRASNGQRTRSFAVNLRPSESELAPLETSSLAALGVPIDKPSSAEEMSGDNKRALRDREAEADQNLWRWAVLILLTMLVVESFLASRNTKAAIQPEGVAT